MRLPAITCLAFSLGSCTLLAACGGSTSLSVPRVYDFTQTGSTLDSYVAPSGSNTVTGYSFILFDRSGTLYSRAGGDRTIEAVRALASGTKLPSVIAIVSLVDSGLITLDAPVAQYLAQDPTFTWPADKAAITMRMLLAHTSGLVGLNDNQPHCLNLPTGTILRD